MGLRAPAMEIGSQDTDLISSPPELHRMAITMRRTMALCRLSLDRLINASPQLGLPAFYRTVVTPYSLTVVH